MEKSFPLQFFPSAQIRFLSLRPSYCSPTQSPSSSYCVRVWHRPIHSCIFLSVPPTQSRQSHAPNAPKYAEHLQMSRAVTGSGIKQKGFALSVQLFRLLSTWRFWPRHLFCRNKSLSFIDQFIKQISEVWLMSGSRCQISISHRHPK